MSLQRARTLRANATEVERKLWSALRAMKRYGLHFRRQPPVGRYFPDFACHRAKLIIELDGSQHGTPQAQAYDAERGAFLESRGYHVLRVWNGELLADFDSAVEFILALALERKEYLDHPPPGALCAPTSPRRGR